MEEQAKTMSTMKDIKTTLDRSIAALEGIARVLHNLVNTLPEDDLAPPSEALIRGVLEEAANVLLRRMVKSSPEPEPEPDPDPEPSNRISPEQLSRVAYKDLRLACKSIIDQDLDGVPTPLYVGLKKPVLAANLIAAIESILSMYGGHRVPEQPLQIYNALIG